jgi:hypothetical protein
MKSILSQRKKNSTSVDTPEHTAGPTVISSPITLGTQPTQSSLPRPVQPTTESRFKTVRATVCEFCKKRPQNLCRICKATIGRLSCKKSPLDNPNSKTADMLHRRDTEAEPKNKTEFSGPFGLGRSTDPFGSGRRGATFPSGKPTPRATILPSRERSCMEGEGEGNGEAQNPWGMPDYWH